MVVFVIARKNDSLYSLVVITCAEFLGVVVVMVGVCQTCGEHGKSQEVCGGGGIVVGCPAGCCLQVHSGLICAAGDFNQFGEVVLVRQTPTFRADAANGTLGLAVVVGAASSSVGTEDGRRVHGRAQRVETSEFSAIFFVIVGTGVAVIVVEIVIQVLGHPVGGPDFNRLVRLIIAGIDQDACFKRLFAGRADVFAGRRNFFARR